MNIRNCCYVMLFLVATLFSRSVSAYSPQCEYEFHNGSSYDYSACEERVRAAERAEESIRRANECSDKIEWCNKYPDDWQCPPSC